MAVHVYTASGMVLALLMVHFSYEGDVEAVLWLFLAAMVVDGTDGLLARRLHVKTVVPNFDGALLDNIVDYITYAFAPMVLLWANGYLPDGAAGGVVAAIPLLASCYQFCRTDAKTEDHFFLGFPSYWNVVAFYAIVCSFSIDGRPRWCCWCSPCWSSCRSSTSTPRAPRSSGTPTWRSRRCGSGCSPSSPP